MMFDRRTHTSSSLRLVLSFAEARRGSKHTIAALAVSFLLAGCTDYAQEFKDEYGPGAKDKESDQISVGDYDCLVNEGVRIFYPEGGDGFYAGDTITVVYGSSVQGSGYRFVFEPLDENFEVDLLGASAGPEKPDGRSCYMQKVVFEQDIFFEGSAGVIKVVPNEERDLAGYSRTFMVYPPKPADASEQYDCSVTDGVKVVYPAGGETFKVGQTIRVVYGSDVQGSGYRFVFKKSEDDMGLDLLEESAGPEGPDGKTCYVQEVVLSADLVEETLTGFIRVVPYEYAKKGANSGEFFVFPSDF